MTLNECRDCKVIMDEAVIYWHMRRGCPARAERLAHQEEARRLAEQARADLLALPGETTCRPTDSSLCPVEPGECPQSKGLSTTGAS